MLPGTYNLRVSRGTLYLELRGEGWSNSAELTPGTRLIVGRGEQANLRIDRKSVSQEHLAIVWNGDELLIQDLDSRYGTLRMPQEAPFKEARFPPRFEDLELKLANELVHFSWALDRHQLVEQTALIDKTLAEKTLALRDKTALSSEKTAVSSDKTQVTPSSAPPASPKDTQEGAKPAEPKTADPVNNEPRPEVVNLDARGLRRGAWIFVPMVLTFAYAAARWGAILWMPWGRLAAGAWMDVLILWSKTLPVAGLLSLCGAAGVAVALKRLSVPVKHRLLIVSLGALLALCWPYVFGALLGYGPGRWWAAAQVGWRPSSESSLKSLSPAELNEQAAFFRERKAAFVGSSYVFRQKFLLQRERVLRDCEGVGSDREWANKRVCLILLVAVTVENFQESQPVVLGQVGERAIFLLSLDGLSRVLDAEGLASPNVGPFLDALASVGLVAEETDMRALLVSPESTKESALKILGELRRRIEATLETQQIDLKVPSALVLHVPGPLESGI